MIILSQTDSLDQFEGDLIPLIKQFRPWFNKDEIADFCQEIAELANRLVDDEKLTYFQFLGMVDESHLDDDDKGRLLTEYYDHLDNLKEKIREAVLGGLNGLNQDLDKIFQDAAKLIPSYEFIELVGQSNLSDAFKNAVKIAFLQQTSGYSSFP